MKATVAILTRWRREDPDRLLEAALRQATELAELLPELDGLRNQNVVLAQQLEIQAKRMAQLEEALQAAQGAAHRQAAPFRIEEKKRLSAPKRPGRKRGHPGAFRHKPDHIDEDIEVQLCSCPYCGGTQFKDHNAIEQLIEDIPPLRPHVTRLTTYQGTCVGCGENLLSQQRAVCPPGRDGLCAVPLISVSACAESLVVTFAAVCNTRGRGIVTRRR